MSLSGIRVEAGPLPRTGRLAARVYDALKERLIAGEWPHGSRLSVEALLDEYGVSKQPVMEALRLLSADGLVNILPQVGCEVASYSAREVVDFFEMFAAVEGAVAAAAALRRSDEQLAELKLQGRAFARLPEIVDDRLRSQRYLQLNHAFHAVIYLMSGSQVMAENGRRLWDLCDFLINTTGRVAPMAHATQSRHREHELVRQAIAARDADEARRQMQEHIVSTVSLILPA
jgi:DNA-binding GntR family transcriptional regulator